MGGAMAWLLRSTILMFMISETIPQTTRPVYDFENASDLLQFTVPSTSILSRSMTRFKDGSYSMKWSWASGDKITHEFRSNPISGSELNNGGIKLWIYNTETRSDRLTVSFEDTVTTPGTPIIISQFNISLDFKGWRAVWVSYDEALVGTKDDIDTLTIQAPTTTDVQTQPLYFDLLRLVKKLSKQSRDDIVPTIGTGLYTPNNFWQQTYRWSQATPTAIPPGTTPDQNKLDQLSLVEKRLDYWYVDQTQSSNEFTGNTRTRWTSLQGDVTRAVMEYGNLNIAKSSTNVITGNPLYSDESEYDNKKFGFVMEKVLLPLALDYYIRSRTIDVNTVAAAETSALNDMATKTAAVARILGADTAFQATFTDGLGTVTPYSEMNVTNGINALNNERKERLMLLLDYIEDQGFTDGSAIGSLDHELNNAGAGYMNAVYLLRKPITDAGKLSNYIATMKWYSEFGEVYQDPFEYAGTTADRMRTLSIFRLFAVLMMPTSTTQEQLDKLRDMAAFGRWLASALSLNEGLAGVIKPDYLGFHHNSYYASAYTPHALHKAALIQYLLSATSFALGQTTKDNIKNGLDVMRIVCVKYSAPNSVSGRFPGFSRGILAKNFPGFAYISVDAPTVNASGFYGEIETLDTQEVKKFLRLYDTTESAVNEYLEDGTIFTSIYYLNSIGSIAIMEAISSKASSMNIQAESAPQGFWAKNYASFVVQRRNDWAVSVKGFNKFVWDFESSSGQNVYGIYQSHGALLVANSEASLDVFDIDKGWDWTRNPGTTTIRMDLEQLRSENRRYYQPMELAGGVMLIGGGDYASGVFGMEFAQPPYRYPAGSFQLNIDFSFKKTVFFADYAIICLGSHITATNSIPNITQTTLFQNKLVDASNPSSIDINGTEHFLNVSIEKEPSDFEPTGTAATLIDTNGNSYYIPDAASQGLNVKISDQMSMKSNGKRQTSGRYATAWLDHGTDPSNEDYEYTILVNKPLSFIQTLAQRQATTNNKVYDVLEKTDEAHVVQINDCPRLGDTQYGYVFFSKSARTAGPLRRVNKAPCIVMVEEASNHQDLYISVSSPNLNLNISRTLEIGSQVNGTERFYSISQPVEVQLTLRPGYTVSVTTGEVKQNGKLIPDANKADHVEARPRSGNPNQSRNIRFKRLEKGFSTEVKLTRV